MRCYKRTQCALSNPQSSTSGADSSSKSTAKPSPQKFEPPAPRFLSPMRKEVIPNGGVKQPMLAKRKQQKQIETPETPSVEGKLR